ncbi:MAG: metallophosphoesterase [Chloroflexota bacterium]
MHRLEIRASQSLQVREVCLAQNGRDDKTVILYASDLHLARGTEHIAEQLCAAVESVRPQIVLLGGDLADTQAGLPLLADVIHNMSRICPVWAISGNHDQVLGIEWVQRCVERAGGCWLDGESCNFNGIQIDGCCRPVENHFSILCAHDPAIFPQAARYGYDLVLAGHLHGSQCVLLKRGDLLYPGALFFSWNGEQFQQGKSTMIVSRGVNDTLPVRWNCPREVILCKIG